MQTIEFTEADAGTLIGAHNGHYAIPQVIEYAVSFGFIIDPFARFTLDGYERWNSYEDYPHEAIIELSDEAIEWLNHGRDGFAGNVRMRGQNWSPIKPDNFYFGWEDGDFGLWAAEDDDD